MRRFFEADVDGILFHRDGTVLDANPALARMVGLPLSQIIGRSMTDFVSPATRHRVGEAMAAGGDRTYEVIGVTGTGDELPLEIECSIYRGGDNGLQRVAIVRDISRRKQRQRALERSEHKYRSLFEDSRDAILITTVEGTIEDVNQAAVDLLGFSTREELLRLDARELYQDAADRETMLEVLGRKGYVKDYEAQLTTRDGKDLTVLETATADRDAGGRVLRYRGQLRDVTEQRALEHAIRQKQKMEALGRLAGGVAHDFSNLLTAIGGFAELLLESTPDEGQRQQLAEILKASDLGTELTRQLLTLSRNQKCDPRLLDLSTVVRGFERLLIRTLGEDIKLSTRLQLELWPVCADPGQVEQVLMNLGVNARDAMPGGGRLLIETRNVEPETDEFEVLREPVAAGYVLLQVTDTGCGMDRETQRQVFEPFFTTKEEGKGTGLGLATVYGIVKQSGGEISLSSEPGLGTTVRIYLPRAEEAAQRGRPARSALPGAAEQLAS